MIWHYSFFTFHFFLIIDCYETTCKIIMNLILDVIPVIAFLSVNVTATHGSAESW